MKSKLFKQFAIFFLLVALSGCVSLGTGAQLDNYDRGEKAFDRGKYDVAIQYFEEYLNNNSDSILADVVMFYLGSSYRKLGKTEEATQIFNRLIKIYKTGYWAESANRELQEMKN